MTRSLRTERAKKTAKARWQTRGAARAKPATAIVGFGRLGGALALGLKRAGWPVTVLPRSGQSVRRAVQLHIALADHETLRAADLCLIAVPDSAIARVAASIREDLGSQTALLHCSGAQDLSALGTDREMLQRVRGSFHPLCAISDPSDDISGHAVALAASDRALIATLWRMALALHLRPIEVPDAFRALYHAGAVMAAGLEVALASAAVDAFAHSGIIEDSAIAALLPLMRSALRGIEQRGLSRALTGPVARGDISVVEAHLRALPPELGEIYRALSLRSLGMVKDQLPAETRNALARILKA